MKRLSPRKTLIVVLLLLFSSISFGTWAKSKFKGRENVLHDLEIFSKVIERIKSNYVEEVNSHELVRSAIEKVLRDLDPHSQFLSGLAYEDLMVSTRGEFGGLGIFISFRDHYPTVISPIEGTPADRVGLKGGDQIIEIEGLPTRDWHVEKAVGYLRGEPGTSVRFKISRPGLKEPIDYEITREIIKVKSVPYYGKFGDYGYIKISNFAKQTRREVEKALEQLEDEGIKALVIDLRSNPGGLLQAATEVSELFLDEGKLIVYTKGRLERSNHEFYSSNSRVYGGYPVVVMVNEASASASEILAGALQDWDAGFVVGQTTFGKGTVQTVYSLSDSEAVKLTTAKYYTPLGRSIHADYTRGSGREVAAAKKQEKSEEGDTTEEADEKPVYHTPSGRIVYGGGGITPDLEFERQKYTELARRLERDALFFSFAVEYSMDHEIKEDFRAQDEVVESFKAFLSERGFEYEDGDLTDENIDYIKKAITREVISKNFGRKAVYQVLLGFDPEFQRVLEILREAPTLQAMFSYAEAQKGVRKASLE